MLVDSGACSRRFPHLQQITSSVGSCYHGDKEYYDGESWTPEDDKCTSCSCQVTSLDLYQLLFVHVALYMFFDLAVHFFDDILSVYLISGW